MIDVGTRAKTWSMWSAITAKGQVTIPKPIRDHLGLRIGGRVKFLIRPDGSMMMLPERPISSLGGVLSKPRRKPVTIEEMRDAVPTGLRKSLPRLKRR